MTVVTASINGRVEAFEVEGLEPLLTILREKLFLTGAKGGCHEGVCGACTVLLDGVPINSCLYPAALVAGRGVETVEGFRDVVAVTLQANFVKAGAVQCGYCTPGFVAMLTGLLRADAAPDEAEVRQALMGNLCRCTGYAQIIEAVRATVVELGEVDRADV